MVADIEHPLFKKSGSARDRSMKSWLHDNGIEMHSTHNEVKSVVAERFIRTFRKQDLQAYNCNIKKCVH